MRGELGETLARQDSTDPAQIDIQIRVGEHQIILVRHKARDRDRKWNLQAIERQGLDDRRNQRIQGVGTELRKEIQLPLRVMHGVKPPKHRHLVANEMTCPAQQIAEDE